MAGTVKIAVCDDEREIQNNIERCVRLLYADAEIVRFRDGAELLAYQGGFDILFLDIQMGEPNGIEAARQLRKAGCNATIIFVTAIEEYVFEAFDVKAFHYLLKPIDQGKFFEVLRKAVEESRRNKALELPEKACIAIKKGTVTRRVYLCEIIYFEVYNRTVIVHTTEEEIEFYGRLTELEKSLSGDFVRCHRAFLVNLRYVQKYDAGSITLDNGREILLSKQKYADFVKRYMQWLKEVSRDERRTDL